MTDPLAMELGPVVAEQPDPLLFATVSGAHLYGFPSRDSDVDLRGIHLLPVEELLGLHEPEETRSRMWDRDGVEMDLVTHDLRKFVRLMLRRNGYVLEQLLSPLVVHTSDAHAELISLAPGVLTSHHAHHYRGFANTQWRLFEKTGELKPLLYTFRALLTGIHLMRSGEVQAHLPTLLGEVEAPGRLPALIAAKADAEHGHVTGVDHHRVRADVEALHEVLEEARVASPLPDEPTTYEALRDFVVRVRLER
ncbi:nucleotidyltransferase [Streptomyces lunaelactis]|uniref:Nucleotidyltransferase n=1 Tax=Streptomyces lunaelactis TaxID=1535768 RepID=A0A2R4SZB2_9ACTN|nr:nucleotidyltransferase domain-containing protein [Streptomyces lunaelactis]AVZ72220.1 nucleotidyltransferase [Streptomyces lunaelactis]NUK04166.1 nucleotidyltransferase domain-containing protein [Streptomyces lunaelactis]NUK11020.1 nucleotidyltransferase domain-containing protein [Streptomyces lunaelactis]NUK19137.1 nucleotidyltransferase domain-containing protein [Streptomyces lunaelactis]NUK27720.1 nucleotidyltransferase domain-containing protein [Streptomyces lunaelactis]